MAEIENKALQKDKKRLVKALFSYTPVNIDELQLKVNDILEVIEETEEGWWRGILNGNIGMFPSNFVIELDGLPDEFNNHKMNELSPTKVKNQSKNVDIQDPASKHDSAHSPAIRQDVKSSNLTTNNEDIIDTPKVPEPIEKKISASKKNVDTAAPRLPPKPVREQARVIYPYTALNEDELSLKEGDIITVISKEIEDKGWWKGELNNRMGVFPDNFVQLIKVEEQKKPERPDKPSKASLRSSSSSDKGIPEFSPKIDKKVLKTPPSKPPPPEVHKKEIERPSPPFSNKKPQVPHPMKKPTRSSLGSKFSGFSTPVTTVNSSKSPGVESSSPVPVLTSIFPATSKLAETIKATDKLMDTLEEKKAGKLEEKKASKLEEKKSGKLEEKKTSKLEEKKPSKLEEKKTSKLEEKKPSILEEKKISKLEEKKSNKIEEKKTNKDLTFEGLESSGKKLVHLTANRAKVPNRRPPSHIFLRETEKENGISSSDPRRLSEPLLSEMKSIMQLGALEPHKKPTAPPATVIETKAKVPPSRPMPPSIKGNKPVLQGSVLLKNTISSEECIVKAPEPIKKTALADSSVIASIPGPDVIQPKKMDLPSSEFKPLSSDKELQELKENFRVLMASTVSKNEFNELVKQVRELRDGLEKCNSYCKKTINELRSELELEKNQRLALETELQKIRECQTT